MQRGNYRLFTLSSINQAVVTGEKAIGIQPISL